jgi:hypothetical protein
VHTVHGKDTRGDDVIEYQRTEHLINEHKMTISKIEPTNINEIGTRAVEFVAMSGESVHMVFGHEGFELLKAVLNQY